MVWCSLLLLYLIVFQSTVVEGEEMAKELYRQERHANQRGTLGPTSRTGHSSYLGWILGFENPLLVRSAIKGAPIKKNEEPKK